MLIVTAEEMRELDRQTIEEIGIPGIVLMENAGVCVAQKIKGIVNSNEAKIVVLAGHGNNGGDGFVIARHLRNSGYDVETWLIGDINKCSADSLTNFHSLENSGQRIKVWSEKNNNLLEDNLSQADIIVDAILGTGVVGPLREPYKNIIKFSNQTEAIRVAVDIPTGVNSNTGEVIELAFLATITVTFGLPKIGQLLYPGADYIGDLVVADISIPPIVIEKLQLKNQLITEETVKDILPKRKTNSHKGTYGHALLIGGSKDMPGAPTLATLACLRSGPGLTTVAVPESIQPMVFGRVPEAICKGLPQLDTGHFSLKSIEVLNLDESKYTAIGIGPGIGIWPQGRDLLLNILRSYTNPVVIDADGLNLLSEDLSPLQARTYPTILTPHPGEMARLIEQDIQYVEQNRIKVSRDLATKHGAYVVLKGAHTIIATPDGEIYINSTGGPELAKGGTGDVLTGMITGFIAQKLSIIESLKIAIYLHGLAGSLAKLPSNYSTLATDVIGNIGIGIQQIMSKSR